MQVDLLAPEHPQVRLSASLDTVVVLGAGVAGLAAADWLSRSGWPVMVIEQDCSAGGGHRSRQIGPYTFDHGSIFYEQGAQIFDLAPDLRALCPQVMREQRRIAPGGTILHYPIDPREMRRQKPGSLARALLDLAWSRATTRRDGTLEAIARQRLGGRFFESTGLAAYIARFHHLPANRIDESFFFQRMAFIERFTRPRALARHALRALTSREQGANPSRPPLHVRPRAGFEPIFARIVARLGADGVDFRFGERVISLHRDQGRFRVETSDGTRTASAVVSTLPLDSLHRALFGEASGLPSLDLTTLFVSAAWLAPGLGNVFYNFHATGTWKRATIYSRIYPEPGASREWLAVEVTAPHGQPCDAPARFEEFRRHMADLGLASGVVLEGHAHAEHAYPLYAAGSQGAVEAALQKVAQTGIVTAGRQGRFEYLPTSSRVMQRVAEELGAACLSSPVSSGAI